jgi:uncharacterized alpha-E superfamily protein
MLSRVADSLYWMARYLERAEHTARLVAVQTEMMLDQHTHAADERWKRILACLGDPIPAADGDNLTDTLLYDPRCRASIVACISAARENCRQARNEVSSQMWEQLNRMFHEVRRFAGEDTLMAQPIEFLNYVEQGVHLFRGINDSTMSHSEGWHFVEVGQYLERAINTATLLDTHFRQQSTHLEWIGLLRSCTAFEAYLGAHTVDIRPEKAAEFLLLDATFPHSIRFSVDRLNGAMANMPASDARGSRATRLAGRLRASLSYIQIEEMMADGIRSHLDEVKRQGSEIHTALVEGYIDYRVDMALNE